MLYTGQNVTGPGPVKFAFASYTKADGTPSPGTGDGRQRLREQDEDGIDAEVLFAPLFATRFIEGIKDAEVYNAMVRAYNEWLAEEYCAVAPDRLIGNAYIPITGVDAAIAELEYAHSVGLRTVQFSQFPNGTGTSKPEDDRFWERALELGIALSPHVIFGGDSSGVVQARTNPFAYPVAAGMSQHSGNQVPGYTLAQMIVNGVFDRFPELRLYFAETNCAYIPGMLYYFDRDFTEYNDWFACSLKKLPSEYVYEHCKFGMVQEKVAVKMAAAGVMPLEWFMWGSDFPHSVGTFPRSYAYIADAFAGIAEETRRKILLENAAEYYGLDLDAELTATPV
jgi:predicted TIM-barrel fold metal-dependent hydrolase